MSIIIFIIIINIIIRRWWLPWQQAGIQPPFFLYSLWRGGATFWSRGSGFGFTNKGIFTLCCGAHEYASLDSLWAHYKVCYCCLCLLLNNLFINSFKFQYFRSSNTFDWCNSSTKWSLQSFFLVCRGSFQVIARRTGHWQPAALNCMDTFTTRSVSYFWFAHSKIIREQEPSDITSENTFEIQYFSNAILEFNLFSNDIKNWILEF